MIWHWPKYLYLKLINKFLRGPFLQMCIISRKKKKKKEGTIKHFLCLISALSKNRKKNWVANKKHSCNNHEFLESPSIQVMGLEIWQGGYSDKW